MLVSGGQVIAIDRINTDKNTLSGDGIWEPLSVNSSAFNKAIYFSGTLNNNKTEDFFSLNNNILSANPEIKYFNLSVNYNVTKIGNVDYNTAYYSNLSFNGNNNVHYLYGAIPNENYSFSYNIFNDVQDNKYVFNISTSDEIKIKDVKISCIGFIGFNNDPIETVNVLCDNGDAISFGGILIGV